MPLSECTTVFDLECVFEWNGLKVLAVRELLDLHQDKTTSESFCRQHHSSKAAHLLIQGRQITFQWTYTLTKYFITSVLPQDQAVNNLNPEPGNRSP